MILIIIEAFKRWDVHSRVGIQNLKDVFTRYNHASQCLSFMFFIPQNVIVQRVLYHIDNCCNDHMHMFYRSRVNIVVNPLRCSIINEILGFIGNYIYSQPVFLTFFTIDASLCEFKAFQNPRINLD